MTLTTRLETKTPDSAIYANPDARKVLQFLLRSPTTIVTHEILPTDEVRYPQLAPMLQLTPPQTVELLSTMVEAGALVADLADKAPACPECGAYQVSTRYLCPKCYNYDISRSFLYEHLKCGKVASDDTFKKGGQLVCPKCQAVLHSFGVEYRAVGAWYKCGNCGESFNAPAHQHFCRPRHHEFAMDRARLIPIYHYRMNPSALASIKKEMLMYNEAVTILESLGLTVTAPGEFPGKSGGDAQPFDIATTVKGGRWSGDKTIAIDVNTASENLPIESVRDFAAKAKEARVSESYLLAVPGLSEEARTLAKNLRVTVIEAPTLKEAMTTLLDRATFKGLSA
jgi:predicted RNA-binding Zn-ribbon protein involved in translation (DUF1610 family)